MKVGKLANSSRPSMKGNEKDEFPARPGKSDKSGVLGADQAYATKQRGIDNSLTTLSRGRKHSSRGNSVIYS